MATNQQSCTEHMKRTDRDAAGLGAFTSQEQERLRRLRRHVLTGTRSDAYPVDKRQDFVRWLLKQGKLSDN